MDDKSLIKAAHLTVAFTFVISYGECSYVLDFHASSLQLKLRLMHFNLSAFSVLKAM